MNAIGLGILFWRKTLITHSHRGNFAHHFRQEYYSFQHPFSLLRVAAMQQTEVVDFSCIISCLCPLSFSKVKHPVRGPRCDHIRFFDRDSFVEVIPCLPYHFQLYDDVGEGPCPLCLRRIRVDELVLDSYIQSLLEKSGEEAECNWNSLGVTRSHHRDSRVLLSQGSVFGCVR